MIKKLLNGVDITPHDEESIQARVFLLEGARPQHDLSTAIQFGEIHVLLKDGERRPSVFDVEAWTSALTVQLASAGFNEDKDMLCLVGSSIILAIGLATVLKRYGRVKVLMFHAPTGEYVARELR